MNLQLSIAMADNPRTRPIFEGKVAPDGIDLICTPLHASELFWRLLRFGDFDVSEMSMSSLMAAVTAGDDRWVGLPIFTTRRMFQVGILVRKDRGIEKPSDLKGKKMGVPEYQQTAALWTPLIEHGVVANRKVLETTAQWSYEQGLTPRLIRLDELFAPQFMEL